MHKLVSIILPCFNGAAFLSRALESVLNQTYPTLELVFVNDGSTDGSVGILESYMPRLESRGCCVRRIDQENQGLGSAINTGLKYVTGAYLTLLDADDLYLPESVERRVRFLDQHPDYGMVRSNGWYVPAGHIDEPTGLFVTSEEEKKQQWIFEDLLFAKTNNWAGTYLLRTDALFACYPNRDIFPSRSGQNLQLMMPVAYRYKTGFIDEPLMKYVQNASSLSHSGGLTHTVDALMGYQKIREEMLDFIIPEETQRIRYKEKVNKMYAGLLLSTYREYKAYSQARQQYNRWKQGRAVSVAEWKEHLACDFFITSSLSRQLYRLRGRKATNEEGRG